MESEEMRLAIVILLVGIAAVAFGAPTKDFHGPTGAGRVWTPLPDPDLQVKWVQTPDPYPYGNGLSSQQDDCYPFLSQMADDFQCDETGPILAIEWWGTYWNPGPPPPAGYFFMIEFWTDNGLPYPDSHPLELIYQEPCYVFTEDYDEDYAQYHYVQYLENPFTQEEGNIYWLSIYAVFCYPPQFGWCTGEPHWADCANFKSEFFGFPDWTSSELVWGICYDMAFVLYGPYNPNPVEEKSWGTIKAMFQ
jgi:hypothetical protein